MTFGNTGFFVSEFEISRTEEKQKREKQKVSKFPKDYLKEKIKGVWKEEEKESSFNLKWYSIPPGIIID